MLATHSVWFHCTLCEWDTCEGSTFTLACPLMNVALVITVFEVLANKDLVTDWL